mgnify:CR=1 FL=1
MTKQPAPSLPWAASVIGIHTMCTSESAVPATPMNAAVTSRAPTASIDPTKPVVRITEADRASHQSRKAKNLAKRTRYDVKTAAGTMLKSGPANENLDHASTMTSGKHADEDADVSSPWKRARSPCSSLYVSNASTKLDSNGAALVPADSLLNQQSLDGVVSSLYDLTANELQTNALPSTLQVLSVSKPSVAVQQNSGTISSSSGSSSEERAVAKSSSVTACLHTSPGSTTYRSTGSRSRSGGVTHLQVSSLSLLQEDGSLRSVSDVDLFEGT